MSVQLVKSLLFYIALVIFCFVLFFNVHLIGSISTTSKRVNGS